MKTKLATVLTICGLLTSSVLASDSTVIKAEIPCYETDSLFNTLKKDYKEIPIVYGLTNDMAESTMSLWTNPTNKSWTIVATKGDVSCVVGAGTDFKFMPLKVGKTI